MEISKIGQKLHCHKELKTTSTAPVLELRRVLVTQPNPSPHPSLPKNKRNTNDQSIVPYIYLTHPYKAEQESYILIMCIHTNDTTLDQRFNRTCILGSLERMTDPG